MSEVLVVVGKMAELESLELGEMVAVTEAQVVEGFSRLRNLKRLRLEKGQDNCATYAILDTICQVQSLKQLELINFDIGKYFHRHLARCENIETLLLVPTYYEVEFEGTNHQLVFHRPPTPFLIEKTNFRVMLAAYKLSDTLKHFVWGFTTEILDWMKRFANALIDVANLTDTIVTSDIIMIEDPVTMETSTGRLQFLETVVDSELVELLPNTKFSILKVPFKHTWRVTVPGPFRCNHVAHVFARRPPRTV
ncbi:hypothetical protein J6590_014017 [Homalodisca vitripennis]|nr:hypothetical protein J6590_014017 [Homalodisca vitripennis]